MSDYKCIVPYYSERLVRQIGYGHEISSGVYYNLQPSEQAKYTRVIKEDATSSSNSLWQTPSIDSYDGSSASSYSSDDTSSSSSDSSSFDFGGGDSGGGGSSGDW